MDGLAFAAQVRNRCDELVGLYDEHRRDAEREIDNAFAEDDTHADEKKVARAEGAIEALKSLRECVTGW